MEPILEVKNLKVSFRTREGIYPAVEDIEFQLEKGKTLGIVGESGCGKSVSSLAIMRLLNERTSHVDSASSVKLNGVELLTKSKYDMSQIRGKEISMIFQDSMTALNPVLKIGKQMVEMIMAHQNLSKIQAKEKAIEMLKLVGIPSPEKRIHEYPHELSGGMRQRVMIAMAMSNDPSVLIADEPTTALDVTIQAQILDLMKELQKESDTAIMFITHDMGVVAEMTDEAMVMYAGNIVEKAKTEDIFENPLHPYTKGLIDSIPSLKTKTETLKTIEGVVPNIVSMPKGCRFCTRCSEATQRCQEEKPEMYKLGDRYIRCFKYEKRAGETCE